MNITDVLVDHARARRDHPAIEDGARIVTYGELDGLVNAAAANLRAAGVAAGDTVAVVLPDSAEHLVVLCALARAGAVILSLNPAASADELAAGLASVAATVVIAARRRRLAGPHVELAVRDICQPAARPFDEPPVGGREPVMLIQSSGTTGAPKTFVRSHDDVGTWVGRYADSQGWTADERCLSLTRMSFNVGRNISLGMLRLGATTIVNRTRSHDALVALVRDKQVSYLKLTPSHLVELLAYAEDKSMLFPTLRAMVVGSAPTTHAQRLIARKRLTPNFYEQLGSNEAGLLALALPSDQDAYPDAVGRIVDGVEAQIVDENDRPLPAGEVGLVRFRGTGFPTHYIDAPDATGRAFRDGWFYPGDLAALNDAGYLFFKGRVDDVINNAGAKFYPIEVETVLLDHPQVSEAAVFAWPHTQHGQVAVACVVAEPELAVAALRKFCAQRLAGYKVPVVIEQVAALPRNAMGKVAKRELEQIIERIAAGAHPSR